MIRVTISAALALALRGANSCAAPGQRRSRGSPGPAPSLARRAVAGPAAAEGAGGGADAGSTASGGRPSLQALRRGSAVVNPAAYRGTATDGWRSPWPRPALTAGSDAGGERVEVFCGGEPKGRAGGAAGGSCRAGRRAAGGL